MELQQFDGMHFLIDDSWSMMAPSDFQGAGRQVSRWEEAQIRLKQLFEILVYIPTPPIRIYFLNRAQTILIDRNNESPTQLLRRVYSQIDSEFAVTPTSKDATPFLRKATESIQNGHGKRIIRYFFGDGKNNVMTGLPDGGKSSIKAITNLVVNRPDPEGNPITCMSCSDTDEDVEWMKELEEIAPFCAEYFAIYIDSTITMMKKTKF
jgi:hypothetical protein